MTTRHLSNSFKGFNFYKSSFDTETGVLVRSVEVPEFNKKIHSTWSRPKLVESVATHLGIEMGRQYNPTSDFEKLDLSWARKYGRVVRHQYKGADGKVERTANGYVHSWRSERAFSPIPETIDVKITDWCNFGCDYCYMDSTTSGKHAPKQLLRTIFEGLKDAPYQVAFGGGEPTAHPDFPWFLEYTRHMGTVPNYTTAGHILRDDVFEATNKYCGGVALTYHAFKGPEYFKKTYNTWRARLDARVQLNVHVLCDKDVVDSLLDLQEVGLRDLNVVLLAYYPSVGRSSWESVPPKGVYEVALPRALTAVQSSGFKVAFSEGLLPYFLSHQLPEVDMRFAGQQEGLFSCYVDDKGRFSHSSFDPAEERHADAASIYKHDLQKLWNTLNVGYPEHFDACLSCQYESRCHIPHESHFLLCKFAEHNKTPPVHVPERKRKLSVLPG